MRACVLSAGDARTLTSVLSQRRRRAFGADGAGVVQPCRWPSRVFTLVSGRPRPRTPPNRLVRLALVPASCRVNRKPNLSHEHLDLVGHFRAAPPSACAGHIKEAERSNFIIVPPGCALATASKEQLFPLRQAQRACRRRAAAGRARSQETTCARLTCPLVHSLACSLVR